MNCLACKDERIRELEKALTRTAAHLAATISLLDSYGMRERRPTSMSDYDKALEQARKALGGK